MIVRVPIPLKYCTPATVRQHYVAGFLAGFQLKPINVAAQCDSRRDGYRAGVELRTEIQASPAQPTRADPVRLVFTDADQPLPRVLHLGDLPADAGDRGDPDLDH